MESLENNRPSVLPEPEKPDNLEPFSPAKSSKSKKALLIVWLMLFIGFSVWATQGVLHLFSKLNLPSGHKLNTTSQEHLNSLGVPLWLPNGAAIKLAPYRLSLDKPIDNEGPFLKFETPDGAIYESPAAKPNETPTCGPYYAGLQEISTYAASCHQIGETQTETTYYTDDTGTIYTTFGATLVVFRPVDPHWVTTDELLAYLKTFRQIKANDAAQLITRNYDELKRAVAKQPTQADFIPLLPTTPVSGGYRVQELALVSLADPTAKPTLRVSYINSNDNSFSLWTAPRTAAFNPPTDCGPSLDISFDKNPCKLLETSGGRSIYVTQDNYFIYVSQGETITVISTAGATGADTKDIAIARTVVPTSKDIFKKAQTTRY